MYNNLNMIEQNPAPKPELQDTEWIRPRRGSTLLDATRPQLRRTAIRLDVNTSEVEPYIGEEVVELLTLNKARFARAHRLFSKIGSLLFGAGGAYDRVALRKYNKAKAERAMIKEILDSNS